MRVNVECKKNRPLHGGDAPPTVLPASALWPLTYYGHTCWQLGDRAIVDDAAPEEAYADPEPALPSVGLRWLVKMRLTHRLVERRVWF